MRTYTNMSNNTAVEDVGLDSVNHPQHYTTHPSCVETIDITRQLEFNLGNAWKYLMRFRYKGNPVEDLEKAIWYLKDYVKNMTKDRYTMSLEQRTRCAGKMFNPNLTQNKITSDMIKVIKSEPDFYVKQAFIVIATFATYGDTQFLDAEQVINELEDHIYDIIGDSNAAVTREIAAEIVDKLEKEDEKEEAILQ